MAEPAFSKEEIMAAARELELRTGTILKPVQKQEPEPAEDPFTEQEIRQAKQQLDSTPLRTNDLSMVERMAATRAKENPDRLEKMLAKRGFITDRKDDEVLIQQGGKFVPWDPEGLDLGDLADLVPEAFEVGAAAATGLGRAAQAGGGPVGILAGTALAGGVGAVTESGMQAIEKAAGFRDEFDTKEIAVKGLKAATIPGTGKIFQGLGKLMGVGGKKAAKAIDKKAVKALEQGFRQGPVTTKKAVLDIVRTFKGDLSPAVRESLKRMPKEKVRSVGEKLLTGIRKAGKPVKGLAKTTVRGGQIAGTVLTGREIEKIILDTLSED
jgi:hypothetical protein